MPSDLTSSSGILVEDRSGLNLPFSKGLMATSILATGVDTVRAHDLARMVQADLLSRAPLTISADDLAELAATTIAQHADADHAERYRRWRRAKRAGRPFVIVLSGAPGVGKSTLATRLALRLGVDRIVPTDAIREVLRTVIPQSVLPELHVSTFETVDPSEAPLVSFRRQARVVSNACAAVGSRLVTEGMNVIIDGVHVVPGVIRRELAERAADADVVELLLTLDSEEQHRNHLTQRRHRQPGRSGHRHLEHFATIRQIQAELRSQAESQGLEIHDVADRSTLTQHVVDAIVQVQEER